jgi:hypothetical protein
MTFDIHAAQRYRVGDTYHIHFAHRAHEPGDVIVVEVISRSTPARRWGCYRGLELRVLPCRAGPGGRKGAQAHPLCSRQTVVPAVAGRAWQRTPRNPLVERAFGSRLRSSYSRAIRDEPF